MISYYFERVFILFGFYLLMQIHPFECFKHLFGRVRLHQCESINHAMNLWIYCYLYKYVTVFQPYFRMNVIRLQSTIKQSTSPLPLRRDKNIFHCNVYKPPKRNNSWLIDYKRIRCSFFTKSKQMLKNVCGLDWNDFYTCFIR